MQWRKAQFKGKDVWIEVDASGAPAAASGRVAMRYSKSEGAKLYRAGVANVLLGPGPSSQLPDGVSADASGGKAKRGSGFGKAGTRSAQQAAMAADAAKALIASLPADSIKVFTDGSCRSNPGPAGSGAVAELPDGRIGEASRFLGEGTNNIAELQAIGLAFDLLDEAGVDTDARVELFSDSRYADGVLCRGWKAKANQDLIQGLRDRLKARPNVTIHWIAGHVGVHGNERADALANAGVDGTSATHWTSL